MPRSRDEYLADALGEAVNILDWTAGVPFQVYQDTVMLRRAVERSFDIIAEAIKEAERLDPELSTLIPDIQDIKGYHVVLAHLYFTIDNEVMWDAIQHTLPVFRRRVAAILGDRPSES